MLLPLVIACSVQLSASPPEPPGEVRVSVIGLHDISLSRGAVRDYRISWDPVPDAEFYKVYFDLERGDNSVVGLIGRPLGVSAKSKLVGERVTATTFDDAGRSAHYYVRACNKHGCSPGRTARSGPAVIKGVCHRGMTITFSEGLTCPQ